MPSHLERIEVRHEPEHCTCPACQSALVKIGEEVTEQLHMEPATFKVIRHIRPQYACRACETIQAAPVAPAAAAVVSEAIIEPTNTPLAQSRD